VFDEQRAVPGARFALRVIHPGSPVLRIRYRSGIVVSPYGLPDWTLYARAVVELPEPAASPAYAGLTVDEIRVVDVLAANEHLAGGDDPLWTFTRADPVPRTPPGWTWAHVGRSRRLALVPVELHGAYRHAGGVSTLRGGTGAGLRTDVPAVPVGQVATQTVPEPVLRALEEHLGYRLPPAYRAFVAATNGAAPAAPGVHPDHGFVHDQPLFGLARDDRHQDLGYATGWLRDRLTPDYLALGYVQGGLLAVQVAGDRPDSVWYWDDDDPRADDRHDAAYICGHLLRFGARTIDEFLDGLALPAAALVAAVDALVDAGQVVEVRPELAGAGLPAARRAPWQPDPPRGDRDPLADALDTDT
jgi:A nuclease of the HNH/ENDO VII superfamily with conserved WHH/SMI1 / KNR4 family (SUKH-1)